MPFIWPGWAASNRQALDLYNYLSQYDDRFTLDGDNVAVDFDGKFKIKILSDYNTYRPHWGIQCSDSDQTVLDTQVSQPSRGYWFENACNPLNVMFLDSEDFIYFVAWPRDKTVLTDGIGFVYIRTTDGKCYAQALNPNSPAADARPFYNVLTANPGPFTLSPFITFAAPPEEIFTVNKCILRSDADEYSENLSLISCSAMTYNQVITIDGKNYFTVGTRTLAPLDS